MFSQTVNTVPAITSEMSIFSLAMALMWGAAELLISIGFISAFSFIVCYGFGAIMEPKDTSYGESDAPSKENTASIFMAAMLSGFHITFVFFGLPLFGHAADSFAMRLIYSIAVIAALTTGVALGTIVIYLAIPAVRACCTKLVSLIGKTPAEQDIEAQTENEAFLDEKKEPLSDDE